MQLYNGQKLKIYNSLTGKKEIFKPINEGHIGMYVCGPTVYSNVHLGNVRTFMSFDMIYRYFLHLGFASLQGLSLSLRPGPRQTGPGGKALQAAAGLPCRFALQSRQDPSHPRPAATQSPPGGPARVTCQSRIVGAGE